MKRRQLVEELKDWIVDGEMKPGDSLPTYEELNNRFDASRGTFHHVLKQLKQDGFVVSVERQGTFLAEHLPCRSRYALIFDSDEQSNVFWTKLAREAQRISRKRLDQQFEVFSCDGVKNELNELQDKLERRLFAGIFFFFEPRSQLARGIAKNFPKIPKVFLGDYKLADNRCVIRLDGAACVTKVMEYAASQRVKKIGFIARGGPLFITHFPVLAKQFGIETRPEWILSAPEKYTLAVKNLVWLLMSLPNGERPEALYVADDNLLPLVQAALVEKGVKVPDELMLICHYNFPDCTQTVLPVKKIGYDVRDILNQGVQLIRSHYTEKPVVEATVSGKYDSEIT
jgi:DNA-binding LacI/PurR family transcriptional regulator